MAKRIFYLVFGFLMCFSIFGLAAYPESRSCRRNEFFLIFLSDLVCTSLKRLAKLNDSLYSFESFFISMAGDEKAIWLMASN